MESKQNSKSPNQNLEQKLDALIRLTQDLFVVQALKAGMSNEAVRKILGVKNTRVSNIAKYLE